MWSESRWDRNFLGDVLRDRSELPNEPRTSNRLVEALVCAASVALTEFLQFNIRSVDWFLEAKPNEFRWLDEVTEPRVATDALRPSIFLENVEPESHVSCLRFWNAQSCRKMLILPV